MTLSFSISREENSDQAEKVDHEKKKEGKTRMDVSSNELETDK